nr:DNA primase small subunit [Cryptococcus depauperatus CBS 7841]ODN95537.1 DNA primase small subunit [Cryptococcus depauperatus CBS 7855]
MNGSASSPQVMQAFYKRLFPYRPIFLWLNQEQVPSKLFTHREFALTLVGDIYLRYQSFNSVDEFKNCIVRHNPSRFEIGPQYSARPKDRKTLATGALQPQRRELVFDIDMTDYDEIRKCCSDKSICKRCWSFISAAVKILDEALRDTFGFKHLLWVYSGRRGIHCWISDQSALDLTDIQRRALVTFLEVIRGGKDMTKKVNVRGPSGDAPVHPFLEGAIKKLGPWFWDICIQDQNCFQDKKDWETLLNLLPSDNIVKNLRSKWDTMLDASSADRWAELSAQMQALNRDNETGRLQRAMEDIILQYTYPRIDSEVTKHRNHLLKSPFCVHPSTGRICVPVDPNRIEDFDPEDVPTVGQLLSELDAIKAENGDVSGHYEQTSLKPFVEMFEKHTAGILRDNMKARRAIKKETLDF